MENNEEPLLTEICEITNESKLLKEQEWKREHEIILVEWADKAMCYRWLHTRSHQAYSKTNAWFTIPVIIMSTLTGTANFAQDRFSEDIKPYAQMGIGAVNIFAGILTTIAQFLKIGELNEAHRVSSISWDKFYRNIKVELAKSRDERTNVSHMIKLCKEEFDRLMETSPSINEKIIKLFNKTFPTTKSTVVEDINKDITRPDIKRPEICDELISTAEIVFITPETDTNAKRASLIELTRKKNKIMENYEREVNEWITKFENKHNRKPLESEMIDNLQDKMNPDILNKIVKKILAGFENDDEQLDALNNV
jgi:DNA-binding MarR family transcriptional regulator